MKKIKFHLTPHLKERHDV